ncbi:hypothetical protein [Rummeliibacillus stabekisii]|uniref:hypothetical protein n=1 Tax=Rummeliibacillus stabekisii TaxID=241244 RepID=UPI00116CFF9B|nr:hypothetical protein [Rummeliibacillus stabekisii]MBB5171624.1 hypothetical protein [Rummeliibacillus stabekisii]GEL05470.1 hypothetical protein RST01_20970 [Rummeliibacillus stabekisii]
MSQNISKEEIGNIIDNYVLGMIQLDDPSLEEIKIKFPNETLKYVKNALETIVNSHKSVENTSDEQEKRDKVALLPVINSSYIKLEQLLEFWSK